MLNVQYFFWEGGDIYFFSIKVSKSITFDEQKKG